MKEAQIISDGNKMGVVMFDHIYIMDSPRFESITVDFPHDEIQDIRGYVTSVRHYDSPDFTLKFQAREYQVCENINKELLDFGLVSQMTVNRLFKEINKKLDKRK